MNEVFSCCFCVFFLCYLSKAKWNWGFVKRGFGAGPSGLSFSFDLKGKTKKKKTMRDSNNVNKEEV